MVQPYIVTTKVVELYSAANNVIILFQFHGSDVQFGAAVAADAAARDHGGGGAALHVVLHRDIHTCQREGILNPYVLCGSIVIGFH